MGEGINILAMFMAYPNALVLHDGRYSGFLALYDFAIFTEYKDCRGIAKKALSNLADCKLVLTPLSEISDDDAIGVARKSDFEGLDSNETDDIEKVIACGKNVVTRYMNRESSMYGTDWVDVIDYLRSKSYDVGFSNISSLIQAGYAIAKPKQ